ncbi:MAG: winged helix-turn-helix transcriptional regulator [Alphaproteobacteria bacterium]|nr:winged helix-turn-helix transcriptional regulator [Alphaproteobacteria bacterium]
MPASRLVPTDCTCLRARSAARRISQVYDRHLASVDLRITQFSLLSHVAAAGPIAVGRLAELLNADRTTLSRALGPLLAGGALVEVAAGDRRRRELAVGTEGRALLRRARPLWEAAEREVRATLGPALTCDLHAALEGAVERLRPPGDPQSAGSA